MVPANMTIKKAQPLPPTFIKTALGIALLGILAACGSSDDGGSKWSFITEESDDPLLPGVNPLQASGTIITAGSSTVFPLSERMVERFTDEGFGGTITVDSIGTGAGFERFCTAGETDLSNASRPINEAERQSCAELEREPIEIRVGTDALAVVVSKDNTFASNVSHEQLAALFSTATTWSDIDPSWPDRPIERFIPGTDSGTFDYFVEEVFDKEQEPILTASNTQMSEDDNILVQGVLGSPYSVGFFGYAYYTENAARLNVLAIDDVEASEATVDDASYGLARPLYIYTTAAIMREKPQVAAFVNFYLTYVNEEVVDVGYFPANQSPLDGAKRDWLAATAGLY